MDNFVQDNLDQMRDDFRELADIGVMGSFYIEYIQEFMGNENALHSCQQVTERTTIEAVFQAEMGGEDDENWSLNWSDTESVLSVEI